MPRVFGLFACSQLGCSTALELRSTLPAKPSYVYTVNSASDSQMLKVTTRPPLDDGHAGITKYNFEVTCYELNNVETVSNTTVVINAVTAQVDGTFELEINSPSETTFTCRVDVQTCTFVGCSLASESSWNIGLNSPINLDYKTMHHNYYNSENNKMIPGNMTFEMVTTAEPNKVHPATTDIRWTHVIDEETLKTTVQSFGVGVANLNGSRTNMVFSENVSTITLIDLDCAGDLVYNVEGRHCSVSGLCSEWFHIIDTPVFQIPGTPAIKSVASSASGGAMQIAIDVPDYYGHHAVLRGRKFRCFVSLDGQQIGTSIIVTLKPSDQTGMVEFTELLASQQYAFLVEAMNGDQVSENSVVATGQPIMNIPGQPKMAPVALELFSSAVVVEMKLPSFKGAPVTQCKLSVGEVGNCGLENTIYHIVQHFAWDSDGLSFVSSDGGSGNSNSSGSDGGSGGNGGGVPITPTFVPPVEHGLYQVKVNNLIDAKTYVVKHTCANAAGYGLESVPLNVFTTPQNLQERQVDAINGNDRRCLEQFPSNRCQSLTQAIVGTPFNNVKYFLDRGIYAQRANMTVTTISTHVTNLTHDGMTNTTNMTNMTNMANMAGMTLTNTTNNITILGPGEEYPISFNHLYPEVHGIGNDPGKVIMACGGQRCFDLSKGSPPLKLVGITMRDGASDVGGGAIYSPFSTTTALEIHSCIFYNHTSTGNGGALFFVESIELKITNTLFLENAAGNSGGAIYIDSSSLLISNVTSKFNYAKEWGGSLRAVSTTAGSSVDATEFNTLDNVAGRGGGAMSFKGSVVNIVQSNSVKDIAQGIDGGGYMFAESCKLTIRSSTVTETQAKAAGGGGLKSTGSQIKLFNVLFNGTASFGNSGGAIDLRLSSIDITSSVFVSCNSIGDARNAIAGGAMSLSVRSTCNTVDSTFSYNVASSGGKSTLFSVQCA